MDLHATYLLWLNILIESEEDLGILNLELEEFIEDYDDGEAEYCQEAGHADAILTEFKTEPVPSFTYKIAKMLPFPYTSIACLTSAYGTTEILPALQTSLNDHIPCNSPKPSQFDSFDIYNTISILLPSKAHVSPPVATSPLMSLASRKLSVTSQMLKRFLATLQLQSFYPSYLLIPGIHILRTSMSQV
jgi:hypothetical protein